MRGYVWVAGVRECVWVTGVRECALTDVHGVALRGFAYEVIA